MKRVAIIAGVSLVVVAMFFGPGLFAKDKVVGFSSENVYKAGFDLIDKYVPGLALDRSVRRDGGVPREGGGQTEFRCLQVTSGAKGWGCIALSPDGRNGIAAWVGPKPDPEGAQFILGNLEALVRPKT